MGAPAGVVYAPWWRRVVAELLDSLVVAGLTLAVLMAGGTGADLSRAEEITTEELVFVVLVEFAFSAAYAVPLLGRPGARNGQTLGKQLLGLRVVRANGTPVTYRLAAVRDVAIKGGLAQVPALHPVGALVVVDYLWALWDPRNQTLHDKVVRTYVVEVPAPTRA